MVINAQNRPKVEKSNDKIILKEESYGIITFLFSTVFTDVKMELLGSLIISVDVIVVKTSNSVGETNIIARTKHKIIEDNENTKDN